MSRRSRWNRPAKNWLDNFLVKMAHLATATVSTFHTAGTFISDTFSTFCDIFSYSKAENEVDSSAVRSAECSTFTVRTAGGFLEKKNVTYDLII